MFLRRRVFAYALWSAGCSGVMSGCQSAAAPTPTPRPTPAPAPTPVATAPTAVTTRYTIPALVTDTRYQVESKAVLERDSAGRRESQQLNSRADAVVRQRRQASGALNATGRMYAYAVQSSLGPSTPRIDSLRFEAVLDAQALRVVLQPPLENECDRPESGALALVRDLFVRVPNSVSVGERWRDSTVQLVCRASIPMVVRTTADYEVLDSARRDNEVALRIRRTTATRLEGKVASPWRALEVSGVGTGTLEFELSVLTGAVRTLDGTSTLTMTVTDKTSASAIRAQQVTQRVTTHAQITGK